MAREKITARPKTAPEKQPKSGAEGDADSAERAGRSKRLHDYTERNLPIRAVRAAKALRARAGADRRVGWDAPYALSAVMCYVVAEVLELAHRHARDTHKTESIRPRDVLMAIKNDAELTRLYPNLAIAGAGVEPHFKKALLNPGQKKRLAREAARAATAPKAIAAK